MMEVSQLHPVGTFTIFWQIKGIFLQTSKYLNFLGLPLLDFNSSSVFVIIWCLHTDVTWKLQMESSSVYIHRVSWEKY